MSSSVVFVSFVPNESNGTYSAQIEGSTVAGISQLEKDFIVEYVDSTHEITTHPTLASAQNAIRETFGAPLAGVPARIDPTEARERKPSKRNTASRNGKPNGRTIKRESKETPAPATPAPAKKTAPAKIELTPEQLAVKLQSIRFRNTYERARGNVDVFVTAEQLKLVGKKFRTLVANAHVYSDKSANIYPTPAQCAKLIAAFPGTPIAAQCELGGWKPWNAASKVAS